jgi:hypothetical protein
MVERASQRLLSEGQVIVDYDMIFQLFFNFTPTEAASKQVPGTWFLVYFTPTEAASKQVPRSWSWIQFLNDF